MYKNQLSTSISRIVRIHLFRSTRSIDDTSPNHIYRTNGSVFRYHLIESIENSFGSEHITVKDRD